MRNLGWKEEFAEIVKEYRDGKKVWEIAEEHGMMIAEVYAVLIEENIEFEVPARLQSDYERAVKDKDKLIADLKRDFENADFVTGDKVHTEKEIQDKKKFWEKEEVHNEQVQSEPVQESMHGDSMPTDIYGNPVLSEKENNEIDILTEIRRLAKKIDDMMLMMKEMQENIGYSKYGSIKRYIDIHDTVTVENLTAIFGSYAKNVLYRLANDGYVKKIARGMYQLNKGSDKNDYKKK